MLNEPLRYDVQGVLEYNVTDLQPDTYYQIQVAALTRRGDGARSPQITVKTPGGVPNRPTINLKYICIQYYVVLEFLTSPLVVFYT